MSFECKGPGLLLVADISVAFENQRTNSDTIPLEESLVINGYTIEKPGNVGGVNVYIKRIDGEWKYSDKGDLSDPDTELIAVDTRKKLVAPINISNRGSCNTGRSQRKKGNLSSYSICNSHFGATDVAKTAGTQAFMTVFTLGLAPLMQAAGGAMGTGGALYEVQYSPNRVFSAIESMPNFFAFAENIADQNRIQAEQAKLQSYRKKIEAVSSPEDIMMLVSNISSTGYDPDGALQSLQKRYQEATEAKKLAAYRAKFERAESTVDWAEFIKTAETTGYDPDNLLDQARKAHSDLIKREKIEFEAEQKRLVQHTLENEKRLAFFRKNLKDGDETNVGLVIESKGVLVKVYLPVQGYGNEHWIRRDQIFPPRYGYRFENGKYIPPISQ